MAAPALKDVESEPAPPSPKVAAYVGHEIQEASLACRKALGQLGWRSSERPVEYGEVPAHKAERIGAYVKEAVDAIQGAQDATADQLGADVTALMGRIEHGAETVETMLGWLVEATGKLPPSAELRRVVLLVAGTQSYLRADLGELLGALRRG